MKNPKFEKHLQDNMHHREQERTRSRYGIILDYDLINNTATVQMSSPGSDRPDTILTQVPCPVTMGVQTVAPEPGRPVWVTFKGQDESSALITHYFNHNFHTFDFTKQYVTKSHIPKFMLGL